MKFDFMKSYKIFKKETFTIKKKRIQVFLRNKQTQNWYTLNDIKIFDRTLQGSTQL